MIASGVALAGLVTYLRRKYIAEVQNEVASFDAETEKSLSEFVAARALKAPIELKKKPESSSAAATSSAAAGASTTNTAAEAAAAGAGYDVMSMPVEDAEAMIEMSLTNLRKSELTALETSLEQQITSLTTEVLETLDGRLRLKLAKWFDTFTVRKFAPIVSEGARSPVLTKAQTAVWGMLDLSAAQVGALDVPRARELLMERMTVAYQLQLLPEMAAAYDALYVRERREEMSLVELIVLFPNSALLGRWRDIRELGAMLTPTMNDFYDTALVMHSLPDMRLMHRLATHYDTRVEKVFSPSADGAGLTPESEEESLLPHPLMVQDAVDPAELAFDEWDIRVLIMDCSAAKSYIPDEKSRQELSLDVKRPPRKFAPGKLKIRRRGALMMMPALLPTKAAVVGPYAGPDKIRFYSYLTMSESNAQHEYYDLKRLTPDNPAGYSQWSGTYQLFEVVDGVVKNVFHFEIGMKLHRVKPASVRDTAVATSLILPIVSRIAEEKAAADKTEVKLVPAVAKKDKDAAATQEAKAEAPAPAEAEEAPAPAEAEESPTKVDLQAESAEKALEEQEKKAKEQEEPVMMTFDFSGEQNKQAETAKEDAN